MELAPGYLAVLRKAVSKPHDDDAGNRKQRGQSNAFI
jgi:hypothetical protein